MVMENELVLSPDSAHHYIKALLASETRLLCVHSLKQFDTLRTFYAQRNHKDLWWNAITGDSAQWEDIKQTFEISKIHGMYPRYYFLEVVDYYRSQLASLSSADSAYKLIAELEIIISNGMIQMYHDIANGRTNPKDLYGYTYMLPENNRKDIDWSDFLLSRKKEKLVSALHENDTTYNELLNLLAIYTKEMEKEESHPIDFSAYPKIELGDTVELLPLVIRKLKKSLEPDSSILDVSESTVYNKDLESKIKLLQEKYNLAADGVMGFKTYKIINTTAAERISQIRANLERQRWFSKPSAEKAPFIYVNLPEYMAYLHYEDSVKWTKVCIGKNLPDNYDELVIQYTDSGWLNKIPKDMETPQIAAKVSVVVINPTWTVPNSIIKNEMYWQMRRDPTYLTRNHYVVYDGKKLLENEKINWARFKPNNVPYKIVQTPGEWNALGKVKYLFWNPFSIYMHDTPQKSKFKLPQRAVSHGCVRLEDPVLFGEFVMQNCTKYDTDDFRIMLGLEPVGEERLEEWDPLDSTAAIQPIDTTFQIRVEKPIPVYFDYRTVYFSLDWHPQFCYDIYDRNKYILRRLEEQ